MYNNKIVICLILARGGSKGIPRKNVKKIGGKPLILHSIDVAKNTKQIDDDESIRKAMEIMLNEIIDNYE